MMVDSHCHLDSPQFDKDREQVIDRAMAAGVTTLLSIGIGSGPPVFDAGLRLAALHPHIYTTVGIHPHEAKQAQESDFMELERLGRESKVLAVGEIGLDFHYDHSPRDVQQSVFIRQMELARSLNKPIIIHCREAWPECMELLRTHWKPNGLRGILHCFSGEIDVAKEACDMGFMISFAGNVTFPKAVALRDAAREVPIDRLLIETDSPYLAPVPHRGKRNEPAFVVEVARQLAGLRDLTVSEIEEITSANFFDFFSIRKGIN